MRVCVFVHAYMSMHLSAYACVMNMDMHRYVNIYLQVYMEARFHLVCHSSGDTALFLFWESVSLANSAGLPVIGVTEVAVKKIVVPSLNKN